MRADLRTFLMVAAGLALPVMVSAQEKVEARVEARLEMPEIMRLNVVSHNAADGKGRVELHVTANRNWTVSVKPQAPGVEYTVVTSRVGKTAEGVPGNNHKVVVEYRLSGTLQSIARSGAGSSGPPLEYVIAAR